MESTKQKIAVVTGGNSGMGFEAVQALAKLGWVVGFTARTTDKAESARTAILKDVPSGVLHTFVLDLDDLASVRDCARTIQASLPVVDVLVCNAGVMTPPWKRTVDGFESQFQTNYLGHALLFQLLKDNLLASSTKRVVNISSLSSEKGLATQLSDFEAIARVEEANYQAMTSYRESKLAQVLFTQALRTQFGSAGLEAYSVHPGVVNTNLFYQKASPLTKALMQPLAWLGYLSGAIVTPKKGVQTALSLILGKVTGPALYWANSKPRAHHPSADSPALVDALWTWTVTQLERAQSRS